MKILTPVVTSKIVQNGLSTIANSKIMQKSVDWATTPTKSALSKGLKTRPFDKIQEHFPLILGVWVGLVQTVLTYRSQDMPKERRVPLAISIGISDALGLAGTLLINGKVKKFTKRVQDRVDKLPIDKVEKDHLKNGVKTAIPFLIFAFMFKYLAQVASTPMANIVNTYFKNKGIIDYSEKNKK